MENDQMVCQRGIALTCVDHTGQICSQASLKHCGTY